MYSFANREDTTVVDEPFYGYYLNQTGVEHPGGDEIKSGMEDDWDKIVSDLNNIGSKNHIAFVKNMAHHILTNDLSFMENWANVYLIRDPKEIICSFSQVIPNPTMKDIGAKRQRELYEYVPGVVIDSNQLLINPEKVLKVLCGELNIPFSERMLNWSPGAIPEDGIWAKYWYKNVHLSSGFKKPNTQERILPEGLQELYTQAKTHYDFLNQHAITA